MVRPALEDGGPTAIERCEQTFVGEGNVRAKGHTLILHGEHVAVYWSRRGRRRGELSARCLQDACVSRKPPHDHKGERGQ